MPKSALEQRIEKGIGPIVLTIDGMNYRDDTVCVCGHWYGAHGINTTRCKGFRCGCYSFRWIGASVPDRGVLRDSLPKCPVCQASVAAKLIDVDDRFLTTVWVHRNPITDAPGVYTTHSASMPLPLKLRVNDDGKEEVASLPIIRMIDDEEDFDPDDIEIDDLEIVGMSDGLYRPRTVTAAGANPELGTPKAEKRERTKFDEMIQRGDAPRAPITPGEEV